MAGGQNFAIKTLKMGRSRVDLTKDIQSRPMITKDF